MKGLLGNSSTLLTIIHFINVGGKTLFLFLKHNSEMTQKPKSTGFIVNIKEVTQCVSVCI